MKLKGPLKILLPVILFISAICFCVEVFHKQSAADDVSHTRYKYDTVRRQRTRMNRIHKIAKALEDRHYSTLAWNSDLWQIVTQFKFSQSFLPSQAPLLAILIASAPENLRQRSAIRTAWSRVHNASYPPPLSIFLVGKTEDPVRDKIVRNEVKNEGDILLGDYKDDYRNLTLKTVHGLIWAGSHLKPFYVLKTDDDCFVNTEVLNDVLKAATALRPNKFLSSEKNIRTTLLQESTPEKKKKTKNTRTRKASEALSMYQEFEDYPSPLYVGSIRWENAVVRDSRSRWFVSEQDFSANQYPPYTSGAGYVLDAAALRMFTRTVRHVRPFANEDAYVGTVMNKAGVVPRQSSRFSAMTSRFWTCNLLYLVVIHGVLPDEQAGLVRKVQEAKQECRGLEVELGWN